MKLTTTLYFVIKEVLILKKSLLYVRRLQVKFISWVFSNADGKHMLSYSVQHPLLIASGIRGLTLSPSELWSIPQGSVYSGMPK